MNIKRINNFFGYMIFTVGAFKILLVVLLFLKLSSNIAAIFSGGMADNDYFPLVIPILNFAELFICIASIIMIFVNIKYIPEVISGYALVIGAPLIGYIIPSTFAIFTLFAQCGMYMKAGSKITKNNFRSTYQYEASPKASRKIIKNTEWFYSDETNKSEIKKQKRKEKLDYELEGWKKLLETGEIDEATYTEETNKLLERAKRK